MAITTNYYDLLQSSGASYIEKNKDNLEAIVQKKLKRISETSEHTNYYTDQHGVEHTIKPVNHFPELKEYEVWMSGYRATGESAQAHLVGKIKARNWGQACHMLMAKQFLEYAEKINAPDFDPNSYQTPARWDYDINKFTYWACSLYDNEEDAREQFG